MSPARIKRTAALCLIALALAGTWAALTPHKPAVEIRGRVSQADLAEITQAHGSHCPPVWPHLSAKWFPISIHQFISARLNPIEVIAVPNDDKAIIVYRGFYNFYYDKQGKHRWGDASYTLTKDATGWH